MFGYIILALVIFGVFYAISLYNWFQTTLTRIKASIQEIGNQLKRQISLIPNLEASVKGYLKHEKAIYEDLTEARKSIASAIKSGDVQKMAEASAKLASLIPNIQVIVESNPELKASEVISKLMDELRDTADKIMFARRLVIDLTADFNVKRVSFPSNIVANMFNFAEQPGLITPQAGEHVEVGGEEMKTPKVDLG